MFFVSLVVFCTMSLMSMEQPRNSAHLNSFKKAIVEENCDLVTSYSQQAADDRQITLSDSQELITWAQQSYQPKLDTITRYQALGSIVLWGAAATSWVVNYYACPADTPDRYQEQFCFDGELASKTMFLSTAAGTYTVSALGYNAFFDKKRKILRMLNGLHAIKAEAAVVQPSETQV